MKIRLNTVFWIVTAIAAATVPAAAQYSRKAPEPQFLRGELNIGKVVLDYMVEEETRSSRSDDTYLSQTVESFSPMIGGDLSGSLYHPNFLSYSIVGEMGITMEETDIESRGGATTRTAGKSSSELGSISASAALFSHKPYAVRYRHSRSTILRDYDFFSRVKVHSTSQSLNWALMVGSVPVTMSMNKWSEHIIDLTSPTLRKESKLEIRAAQESALSGSSRVKYSLEDYDYTRGETDPQSGTRQSFSFVNRLKCLEDNKLSFSTLVDAYFLEGDDFRSDRYSGNELIHVKHAKNLDGDYTARYSRSETDTSSNDDVSFSGSLKHRLYESLKSTVYMSLDGTEVGGGSSVWANRTFGVGFNESYRKKLSDWGRLTLSTGMTKSTIDRESDGSDIRILDEPHRLADGEKTFLNLLNPNPASVVVTDSSGKVTYVEGIDYRLISFGQSLEIQRIIAGLISNGSDVLVDYSVRGSGSESYGSLSVNHGASLSFLDGRFNMYARFSETSHDGVGSLTFEDLTSKIIGTDISGTSFKVGVERQEVESSYIPYTSVRFFQDYYLSQSARSTLILSMSQRLAEYPELDQNERIYSTVLTCSTQITPTINASFSTGLFDEKGRGIERDYEVYRGGLNWHLGMATLAMTFHITDERDNDSLRDEQDFRIRFERAL